MLTFPVGLMGMEHSKHFELQRNEQLLQYNGSKYVLKCTNQPDLFFTIADPAEFGIDYPVILSAKERELLQYDESCDVAVVIIVFKGQGVQTNDYIAKLPQVANLYANIRGPLVINVTRKLAIQKELDPVWSCQQGLSLGTIH